LRGFAAGVRCAQEGGDADQVGPTVPQARPENSLRGKLSRLPSHHGDKVADLRCRLGAWHATARPS
jgi:hypothetical protein